MIPRLTEDPVGDCPGGCLACVNSYGDPSTYCTDPDCIPVYYGTPCDACESLFKCDPNDCEKNAGCQSSDQWWANTFDDVFGGGSSATFCTDQYTPAQLREMIGRGLANQGYIHVCTDSGRVPNCAVSDDQFQQFMADKPTTKTGYVLINKGSVQIPSCHSNLNDPTTFLRSGPVANIKGTLEPGFPPDNIVSAYAWRALPFDDRSVYLKTDTQTFYKFVPLLKMMTGVPPLLPNLLFGIHQCPQQVVNFYAQPDYVNTTGNEIDTLGWAAATFGTSSPWYIAVLQADNNPYGWPQFSAFVVKPDLPFSLGVPWTANADVTSYTYQTAPFLTFAGDNVSGKWRTVFNPDY